MRINRRVVVGALAAGAAAGVAAGVRADRKWRAADDPVGPDELTLPDGKPLTVHTDDGAALAATVMGEGPMVVLAHGWTLGQSVWAPVAHRLVARGHTVVVYDQRGHGESTTGSEGFSIDRLGHDLAAVLEAVDARDADVAGHSMGGMTLQAMTLHRPDVVGERVARVVLVSTASHGLGRGSLPDRVAARVIASPLIDRAMRTRRGHALTRGTVGRTVRHAHVAATRDFFVATAPATRGRLLTAMTAMDLSALTSVDVPVTVVVGTHDQLTPLRLGRELAQRLGAELVVLPDAGHMLMYEEPDRIAELHTA
jgi:pimeloyl-ACP methyl ester carboxylesterase